ncbi:MAG: hypothetical protein P8O16_11875 [Algoriphagus sp.]|uniref:hypothetical protein n=1 Tax=Algoriphagus sp. TaxID=1872435 RepID=UPI0026025D9A|nr:hypothetical protein [Algoriphagus sp.]MDG1277971.1 hypothetical protein [Algoriphagus sp.]
MTRSILFISIILISAFSEVKTQRYGTTLGIRMGNNQISRTFGITAQQRIAEHASLEAILQSDFNLNSTFSILAKKHHPIISKRFNYYYGAGLSLGKEESYVKNESDQTIIRTYGNNTTGVDLIGGIEMTLLNTVISLDYKPNINLVGRSEFYRGQIGLSARMVLVKSKEQKKKQRQRQKARNKQNKPSFNEKLDAIFKK